MKPSSFRAIEEGDASRQVFSPLRACSTPHPGGRIIFGAIMQVTGCLNDYCESNRFLMQDMDKENLCR